MNIEQWKKAKDAEVREEIHYRDLVGLKLGERQRLFYPDSLVQFVKNLFSEVTITDLSFQITENDRYSVELLRLEATVGNVVFILSLYLEIKEDNVYLQFLPLFDGIRENTVADLQKPISLLYQEMNTFMETYSTKRLLLLTSNVEKTIPKWMEGSRIEDYQ